MARSATAAPGRQATLRYRRAEQDDLHRLRKIQITLMSVAAGKEMFAFAEFSLDPRRRLLFGANGEPIALNGRAFDTLLYLVEHADELVDKRTLMRVVWPNVIVEGNNLNQTISALRRILGEMPGEHRFIVTVPGRGYRFAPSVVRVESTAGAKGHAGGSSTDTADIFASASVAVLPFANLTGDSSTDYFCDGLAEALINELVRVSGLKVPARTSSFAYKGRNLDVRQIGRDLGVATVLEGSVRSAGEHIRVTAQLVNARTGFHFWSQSYDKPFGDVFTLEDEIAHEIVEILRRTMNVEVPSSVAQTPPTRDPEAYRLYLQGRAAAMPAALTLFAQAIAKDPQFARAYAASAQVRANLAAFGPLDANGLRDAEREAKQALALEPQLPEACAALATISACRGNWLDAEASFQEAMRLGPDDSRPTSLHAIFVLTTSGHLQEALEEIKRAYGLAPASVGIIATLAAAYNLVGSTSEAVRYADLAANLGGAEHPLVHVVRMWAAIRRGDYAEAAEMEMKAAWSGRRSDADRSTIKQVYAALGDIAERGVAARALRTLLEHPSAGEPLSQRKEDCIFLPVLLGDLDLAFDSANHWLDRFSCSGTIGTTWGVLWIPEMRLFRRDPRFQRLAMRLKLFDYWKRYGPPDDSDAAHEQIVCR
jgi:TolB-like protein/Flp pilus assembly protein TadD